MDSISVPAARVFSRKSRTTIVAVLSEIGRPLEGLENVS